MRDFKELVMAFFFTSVNKTTLFFWLRDVWELFACILIGFWFV